MIIIYVKELLEVEIIGQKGIILSYHNINWNVCGKGQQIQQYRHFLNHPYDFFLSLLEKLSCTCKPYSEAHEVCADRAQLVSQPEE